MGYGREGHVKVVLRVGLDGVRHLHRRSPVILIRLQARKVSMSSSMWNNNSDRREQLTISVKSLLHRGQIKPPCARSHSLLHSWQKTLSPSMRRESAMIITVYCVWMFRKGSLSRRLVVREHLVWGVDTIDGEAASYVLSAISV
jgi:hypothetical protein